MFPSPRALTVWAMAGRNRGQDRRCTRETSGGGRHGLPICPPHWVALSWTPEHQAHPRGCGRLLRTAPRRWALSACTIASKPHSRRSGRCCQEHYVPSPATKTRLREVRLPFQGTPRPQSHFQSQLGLPPEPVLQMKKPRLMEAKSTLQLVISELSDSEAKGLNLSL